MKIKCLLLVTGTVKAFHKDIVVPLFFGGYGRRQSPVTAGSNNGNGSRSRST